MSIGFIGTGNMADALIKGLLSKQVFTKSAIHGFDIDHNKLTLLKKKYGIHTTNKLVDFVSKVKIIVLSVKPQQMKEVLQSIQPALKKSHLVISIAAGLPLKFYLKHLGKNTRFVRVMPNTPAMINLGVSGFVTTKSCATTDKKTVQKIFSAVGLCFEVPKEELIDSVTAISGSGPAYVYLFAQAMIQSAIKLKLKPDQSKAMVIQTLLGAARLLETSSDSTSELIKKVASKGGTTEAAIQSFQSHNFEEIVQQATVKAFDRSKELAKILGE